MPRQIRKAPKTIESPLTFDSREAGGGKLGIGGRLGGRLDGRGCADWNTSGAGSCGGGGGRSGLSFGGGGTVIATPFIARLPASTQPFVAIVAEGIAAR